MLAMNNVSLSYIRGMGVIFVQSLLSAVGGSLTVRSESEEFKPTGGLCHCNLNHKFSLGYLTT